MSFKCWQDFGSTTLVQSHTVRKSFDRQSFSPHDLIVSFPIEWGGQTVIVDVEVVFVPIDYNFLSGSFWIHAMIAIVSLESQVIWFPHWGNIVMIDQLDYCMLETTIQSNVHFIRDSLNEFQDIKVGSFKNYSLMGNFMIPQPLSTIKVLYQAIEMDLAYLDQNLPLMEEYDPVT